MSFLLFYCARGCRARDVSGEVSALRIPRDQGLLFYRQTTGEQLVLRMRCKQDAQKGRALDTRRSAWSLKCILSYFFVSSTIDHVHTGKKLARTRHQQFVSLHFAQVED